MKIYEILDRENELSIGTLIYYKKSRTFIIELQGYLDEWNAPLLMTSFVKRGIFTIPRDISLMWVRERIIPSGRQNIGMILKNHHLKEYDEMKFLELSEGRCSQDSLYIEPVKALPEYGLELYTNKKSKTDPASSVEMLEAAIPRIEKLEPWTKDGVHDGLISLAEELGVKNAKLLWPVRIALSGQAVTPGGAVEICCLLGREESLRRLRLGLDRLRAGLEG